jgi:hypothetical protein
MGPHTVLTLLVTQTSRVPETAPETTSNIGEYCIHTLDSVKDILYLAALREQGYAYASALSVGR